MKSTKKFRNNGVIGALLDEYEQSIKALKIAINDLTPTQLTTVVDTQTKDEDCKSIQTILTHVVSSGYVYVIEIRKSLGEDIEYVDKVSLESVKAYQFALDQMFAANEKLFEDYPDMKIEEKDNSKKILVRWGQSFDVEQLLEHAIVHILRHRRQIEKFLIFQKK
jgi:uncharacterized damage-inducible protein DinB